MEEHHTQVPPWQVPLDSCFLGRLVLRPCTPSTPAVHHHAQFAWLEHPQGSPSFLARTGHLQRLLLVGSTRFVTRVVLLGGTERFAEQNQELTTGRAPVWMLLEVLLHREVGTSLPPLLGKLGPWRAGTPGAHQHCSLKEAAAEGFC